MTPKDFEAQTCASVKKLMKHFNCKGNSCINFKQPIPITYRYYDEVYQCPSITTDDAHGIELIGTTDFEVILANGVVYSSDIEDLDLKQFLDEVFEKN